MLTLGFPQSPGPPRNVSVESLDRKFLLTWRPPELLNEDFTLVTHMVHFFETDGN